MNAGAARPPQSEARGSAGTRRTRWVFIAAVCVVVVLSGSFALTEAGGWAPLLHWNCEPQGEVVGESNYYIPAVLVNSPYRGQGWGNGSFPSTFPGVSNGIPQPDVWVAYGTGAEMGSALGAFFTVNVSIESLGNVTQWGPGSNVRCLQPYIVGLTSPSIYAEAGGSMLGPNNTSDWGEPHFALIYQSTASQLQTLDFNNSFESANSRSVSTCGGPAQSVSSVEPWGLGVSFPLTLYGHTLNIPFTIPVLESFHYVFPGNFGTWQVDNLSAPGGPGGGWAFSYSPCQ